MANDVQERVVLLIGGSSCVGKNVLARAAATRLRVEVFHVDDLVCMAGSTNPAIRFPTGVTDVWSRPAETLRDGLIAKGNALEPMINDVVTQHLREERRVVIEGEGIQPDLALSLADDRRVRCVFIVEEDERRIVDTLRTRSGGSDASEVVRLKVARMDALYGRWLRAEAERHGLPWLPSQPWATLLNRFCRS